IAPGMNNEEMMKSSPNIGTKTNASSTFANLRSSSLYKSTHVEEPKVQTSFEEDVLHAHQTMHSVNNTTSNYDDETEDDFPTFLK
ncbi:cell division protein FtsZ, partial [Rhizobium sp. KAs_5_22]